MIPPTTKRSTFACLILVLLLLSAAAGTVPAQTTAARPDRGVMPNGSYSVSDIENISLQNGNVNLEIPLASLPPIAGGKLGWILKAHYNSKLWDLTRTQANGEDELNEWHPYVIDTPQLSERGGWRFSGQYIIDIRPASADFDYLIPGPWVYPENEYYLLNNYNWYKVVLIMPDGAEHELRPMDYSTPTADGTGLTFLHGYHSESPYTQSSMRYYSFDGSYLYATINTNATSWTVYLPDGTKVVQTTDGIQRLQDTNGNKIKIFSDSAGTHYQDEQTGREIRYGADGKVWYQTVGGVWKSIEIVWGSTTVQGQLYHVKDWVPYQVSSHPCQRQAEINTEIDVVREIVLPQTEAGVTRKFIFSYNSDTTETAINPNVRFTCTDPYQSYSRTASKGWGSLKQIQTPSGAVIDYSYTLDAIHLPLLTDNLAEESITQKKLTHDGTFDIWTYSVFNETGTVTNPEGGTVEEKKYAHSPGYGFVYGKAGLVYRSTRPFVRIDRHWSDLIFSGASTNSPGGPVSFNPVVDKEYTTLLDSAGNFLKMSAKAFQYDYNGNLIQTTEYDWFDPALVSRDALGVPTGVPGSATVLRVVNNSYYNPATTSTSGNVYAKRSLSTGAPLIVSALKETTVGPAITQLSYDGQAYGVAPTVGNLTSQKVWDDLDSKWITSSQTYGTYGNLVSKTDPRGNVTQFYYDDATHALPNRVVVDPENGTGTQTTSTAYDYYTGLVTSQTDVNGKIFTIDYTNQLLGTVDPFGRPGISLGPLVNVGGVNQRRKVKSIYEDSLRRVTVSSDLNTEGDFLLKSRTTSDQLGRAILSEQSENGSTYTISSQTVYQQMGRITFVSNPKRSAAAETDSWTRTTKDTAGRIVEVATFATAALPPDTGTNANGSGKVTTLYEANSTTVTDQAGKVRRSMVDGLGRLVRVDEPDANNSLGTTASPVQPTSYTYDQFDNLLKVTQGTQTRYFLYDSLKRLVRARNPEQSTHPSLNLSDPQTGNTQWSMGYQYDDNGNLTQKTDARGVTSVYTYDALNRNTTVNYSDTTINPDITRVYDGATNGVGRLWQTYAGGTETAGARVEHVKIHSYDVLGRPLDQLQRFKSNSVWSAEYQTLRAYSVANVTSQTYPSGRSVNYAYDAAGRLTSFTGNLGDGVQLNYATGISYNSSGQWTREQFGTQTPLYNKRHFNSRGQLYDMRLSTVNDAVNWNRGAIINYYSLANYGFGTTGPDTNGNVYVQQHWVPNDDAISSYSFMQQNYDYDSLNRLRWVGEYQNGATGTGSQSFTYDRWGNRTISAASGIGINAKPFTVNAANNRLGVPSGQTGTMTYDAAGNLTTDTYSASAVTRAYDADNRMASETQAGGLVVGTYTYKADGQRVRRKVNGVETWQVYGMEGELLAEYPFNGGVTSPQKEYGYRNGELLVTAEPGAQPPLTPQNVVWTSVSPTIQVTGNSIQKVSGTSSWYDAGAVSSQTINSDDGYMELTPGEINTWRMCGLGNTNSSAYYGDIEYAFFTGPSGGLQIYESGTLRGSFGTYAAGDRLKVAVEGGVVKYYRNSTLVYTSTVAPQYPLQVDTSLNTVGAGVYNVVITTTLQNVTWSNVSPTIQVTGNSIQKTSGTSSWYDAGAVSSQTITAGDGYIEFTPGEINTWRMCGLGNTNSSAYYGDIEYAFFTGPSGGLHIYESGTSRGSFGTYGAGDRLKVAVEGGVVKYYRNSTLVYTSTVAPQYPLQVDSSLNTVGAAILDVVISASASAGNINWLVSDHLGTPRIIADKTGSLAGIKRHDYLPFGEELLAGTGGRTIAKGYSGDNVRQKFTLKERDIETGLDYFLARFYSSMQGRFTSVDPENAGAKRSNPQSWNGYAYTYNNPVNYQDPDGLSVRVCDTSGNCTDDKTDLSDEEWNKRFYRDPSIKLKDGKIYKNGEFIGTFQNLGIDGAPFSGALIQAGRQPYEKGALAFAGLSLAGGALASVVIPSASITTLGLGTTATTTAATGGSLAGLSIQQLNLLIKGTQKQLLSDLFGQGMAGAQSALAAGQVPAGLTRQTLLVAREIALRAVGTIKDKGGVQAVRLKVIEEALKKVK